MGLGFGLIIPIGQHFGVMIGWDCEEPSKPPSRNEARYKQRRIEAEAAWQKCLQADAVEAAWQKYLYEEGENGYSDHYGFEMTIAPELEEKRKSKFLISLENARRADEIARFKSTPEMIRKQEEAKKRELSSEADQDHYEALMEDAKRDEKTERQKDLRAPRLQIKY